MMGHASSCASEHVEPLASAKQGSSVTPHPIHLRSVKHCSSTRRRGLTNDLIFPCVMAHVATFFPAPSTIAGYASASVGTWITTCSTELCAGITWQPALCRFIAYLDQAYGCLQQHCAPITSQLALATVLMLIEAGCAALPHTLRCTDASEALCADNQ